jgi:hypothetical protein
MLDPKANVQHITPRHAMVYLLWVGEKTLAGDPLTEEETAMFVEARQASIALASKIMRIKPHEYEYTPGRSFGE